MSHSSFLRLASTMPADVLLSDYEPFNIIGTGKYGISSLDSVSDKTESQVRSKLAPIFKKQKTAGYSLLKSVKAVFFDLDSTVVAQETIVELSRFAGKEKEVADITERAMNGELDFAAALAERVATLSGLSDNVFEKVATSMTLSKGVQAFTGFCREIGVPVFLVSGGFMQVAEHFQRKIGFQRITANVLQVEKGLLTGRTAGPVVDANAKLAFMKDICEKLGVRMSEVAAVGDGANDLPMLQAAGVAVGFCPKPLLYEHVHAVIADGDHAFLAPLLFGRSIQHLRNR